MNIIEKTKEFIIDTFLYGDETDMNNDTSFIGTGIIDSTGILELLAFVEETFDIKVEDDELLPDNFDSLNKIESYLKTKLNSNG